MNKVKVFCLFSMLLISSLIPSPGQAKEILRPAPYLRVEIFEPENIYQEDYAGEELVITSSAWVNRAIQELDSEINYLHERDFDPPLEKTEEYDASRLDQGILTLYDKDHKAWTFQTINEKDQVVLRIQMDLSQHGLGSEEEFNKIGRTARVLEASIDLDKLYETYEDWPKNESAEAFTVDDVTISRDPDKLHLVTVQRDLTEEVQEGSWENYANQVTPDQEEDENLPLLTVNKIEQHVQDLQNQQSVYFDFINQNMVSLLTNPDLTYGDSKMPEELASPRIEPERIDIFSPDYPEIPQAFLNREWLNRLMVEVSKQKANGGDLIGDFGLLGYGLDANMAYFYPSYDEIVYLYSGIFNDQHLVELNVQAPERYRKELADLLEDEEAFNEAYFDRFDFYAKTLDHGLSPSEIEEGFQQFFSHNNNFDMGKLKVYQEGLREDVIYFSRDITEEVNQASLPDYTEGLADPDQEPLVNDERLVLGSVEPLQSIAGEDLAYLVKTLFPVSFTNNYESLLEEVQAVYMINSEGPVQWSGTIVDIRDYGSDVLVEIFNDSHSSNEPHFNYFLVQTSKKYINNSLNEGERVSGAGHFMGYHYDYRHEPLPLYYVNFPNME